jgi:hypothetical protein
MHAKSGLRVVLKWKIYRPDSVIAAVIPLEQNLMSLLTQTHCCWGRLRRFHDKQQLNLNRWHLDEHMEFSYPPPANESDFETLCLRLLRCDWQNEGLQLYGARGQKQHGVDVFDPAGMQPRRAAQCKLHGWGKTIPPREIRSEVGKALTFPSKIDEYFILTTGRRSAFAQNEVLKINESHAKDGLFRLTVLSWGEIEELLGIHTEVRNQLYYANAQYKNNVARICLLEEFKQQLSYYYHEHFCDESIESCALLDCEYPECDEELSCARRDAIPRVLQRVSLDHPLNVAATQLAADYGLPRLPSDVQQEPGRNFRKILVVSGQLPMSVARNQGFESEILEDERCTVTKAHYQILDWIDAEITSAYTRLHPL